jgi:predicted RNA binding protein YcfA (HicA-like mRNA interferase family)
MTKADKLLEKMRNNPRDWQISELEGVAARFGVEMRKTGGSHVTFSHPVWIDILTIPAHRPIKPIYVKKFVALIDMLNEGGL